MTLVRLRGRIPSFGQLEALPSGIIAIERWNGSGPVSTVSGHDYIPDTILRTAIVDGEPADPLDILPTDGTYCVRWTIAATGADHSEKPLVRFTSIPASSEVNFGDLPDVDPSTFTPLVPLPPSAQQILEGASASAAAAAADATEASAARTGAEAAKTAAETARTTATGARDAALQAKTDAQSARDAAASSAQGAANAATAATTSAGNSATSATNAANSATAAATSASDANTAKTAAANSATAAATSATNASTSAEAAATARTGAETAKTAAETARTGAESAKTAAETARTGAESAKTAAETARTGAETAKSGADSARTGAETARTGAEAARDVALAGQFYGADLLTTDLNTVYSPGVYRQPATASAQVARGYPVEGVSGMLIVLSRNNLGATTGRAIQQFYPQIGANGTDARLHYERASNSGGWSPWRVFTSTRIDSPSGQPGATAYIWNEVNNNELQLAGAMIPLSTSDLDTVTVPGAYLQASTSSATLARHYPIASVSGVLEVLPASAAGSVFLQRFTVTGGGGGNIARGMYLRRYNAGVWDPWNFVPQHRVDNTAGRALYTWDDTTNREQLIYGDTGWRDISADLINGWTGTLLVRRNGWAVEFRVENVNPAASTSNLLNNALAAGFRPGGPTGSGARFGVHVANTDSSPMTAYRAILDTTGVLTVRRNTASATLYGSVTYLTSDAWPTSLPGTAFGGVPNV